jgi:hypothetical protein
MGFLIDQSQAIFPRYAVTCVAILLLSGALFARATDQSVGTQACAVLTGLGGIPEYEENFRNWGDSIEKVCRGGGAGEVIRLDGSTVRRPEILARLVELEKLPAATPTWIFLIGHGSYDGRQYKFNIKGPDLTGQDLAGFLDKLGARPTYVILATSCAGTVANQLKGPHRVIVSATRSGTERHPPLFMSFFAEAAQTAEADENKDRRVSLQEVFDYSQKQVQKWYEEKGRLQTEHPVLIDAGGTGGLARVAYLSKPPEQAYRSLEARQLAPERTRLEREIEDLKLRKQDMASEDYYSALEKLLLELSKLNEKIRSLEGKP